MKTVFKKLLQIFKDTVINRTTLIRILFLAIALILTVASIKLEISPSIAGYSGDTAKTLYAEHCTIRYTNPSPQYKSTKWKNYKQPSNNLFIYHAWYSFHWKDSGISQTEVKGDNAQKILYELSRLKPTGKNESAITDKSGKSLYDTFWLQTADAYYRISGDNRDIIIKVDDYYGAGKAYKLPSDIFALIQEVYNGYGPTDKFSGEFNGQVATVTKTYDGESENALIITDFESVKNQNHGYNYCVTFTFTPSDSGKYSISGMIRYSEDQFADYKAVTFTAQKGKPVTVKVPFSSRQSSFDVSFKCKGVNYVIYVH